MTKNKENIVKDYLTGEKINIDNINSYVKIDNKYINYELYRKLAILNMDYFMSINRIKYLYDKLKEHRLLLRYYLETFKDKSKLELISLENKLSLRYYNKYRNALNITEHTYILKTIFNLFKDKEKKLLKNKGYNNRKIVTYYKNLNII